MLAPCPRCGRHIKLGPDGSHPGRCPFCGGGLRGLSAVPGTDDGAMAVMYGPPAFMDSHRDVATRGPIPWVSVGGAPWVMGGLLGLVVLVLVLRAPKRRNPRARRTAAGRATGQSISWLRGYNDGYRGEPSNPSRPEYRRKQYIQGYRKGKAAARLVRPKRYGELPGWAPPRRRS